MEDNKKINFIGNEEIIAENIIDKDGVKYDARIKDLNLSDEEKVNLLRSLNPNLSDKEIAALKGEIWTSLNPEGKKAKELEEELTPEATEEVEEEVLETETEEEIKVEKVKQNGKTVRTVFGTIGVLGLAAIIAGNVRRCSNEKDADSEVKDLIGEPITIEETVEETSKVEEAIDLETLTLEDIQNMIKEGKLNKTQADAFTKIYNFMDNTSVAEDWERKTLTDKEFNEVNEALAKAGLEELTDKEVVFNYTPEEVLGLMYRYGHYTADQIVEIANGTTIDPEVIMNKTSNKGIEKTIIYLFLSKECKLGSEFVNLFGYEGEEAEFVTKSFEMAKDVNASIETEDLNKVKESILDAQNYMLEYIYNGEQEYMNSKAFIIDTVVFNHIGISNAFGLKETRSYDIRNIDTDKVRTVESKRDIYSEDIKARLYGVNNENYYEVLEKALKVSDNEELINKLTVERGIANVACGNAQSVLQDASLRQLAITTAAPETYENAISSDLFLNLMNEKLVNENKASKGENYWLKASLSNVIYKMNLIANPTLGGKPGDVIIVEDVRHVEVTAEQIPEAQRKAAEEKAAAEVGAVTEENFNGSAIHDLDAQAIYDAVVSGQNVQYNENWTQEQKTAYEHAKTQYAKEQEEDKQVGVHGGEFIPTNEQIDGIVEEGTATYSETTETKTEVIDGRTDAEKEAAKELENGQYEETTQTSGPTVEEVANETGATDIYFFEGALDWETDGAEFTYEESAPTK